MASTIQIGLIVRFLCYDNWFWKFPTNNDVQKKQVCRGHLLDSIVTWYGLAATNRRRSLASMQSAIGWRWDFGVASGTCTVWCGVLWFRVLACDLCLCFCGWDLCFLYSVTVWWLGPCWPASWCSVASSVKSTFSAPCPVTQIQKYKCQHYFKYKY